MAFGRLRGLRSPASVLLGSALFELYSEQTSPRAVTNERATTPLGASTESDVLAALRDASSHLTTHIDENGMFVIRGRLAPEAGEVLMKALKAAGDRLYAEQPKDRPPAGKVRADALVLVAESALKGGLDPGSSGDRYQVVVHVNADELQAAENPSAVGRVARVSAETRSTHEHGSDPRQAAAARVSAEAPTRLEPAERPPSPNGAWLGDSQVPVSAETARRIACDAGKVCMSHRSGQILNVGRKTRTIPPPIRRALEFRDRGCRFPGCTSKHCDAHHVVHWADGGETKLSNLVLLCRRHHRLLHEGDFRVRMSEDGAVQFLHPRGRPLEQSPAPPPVGLDPAREMVERLENAGLLITGKESMPTWDGRPMDLPYVMECLWRPPPHLEAVVARERAREGPRQSGGARAA